MIKIYKRESKLLLEYVPGRFNDSGWIEEKLEIDGEVTLRRTFNFRRVDQIAESDTDAGELSDGPVVFQLGLLDGDYYRIERRILGIKYDLLIWAEIRLDHRTFVAVRDISVFRKIDALIEEPIIIGGNDVNAIPVEDFEELLANFPTSTELTRYSQSRITGVLKDYLGTMSDAQKKLDTYLNRKRTIQPLSRVAFLAEYEPRKFEYVRDELQAMLEDAESYSEKEWQRLIVGFLLLIYPKYVSVLENLHIKDYYSNPAKATDRYIDLTLVDVNGTIDIVEIKKPFENCLLSRGKYRGNYTPRIDLAGAVMQAEKYIFHLSKWGREGERRILKKRAGELPKGFEIRITNPKAILILGRDADFASDQKFDFEIIKRKYANIVDIVTYDDLLRRLENIISMIGKNFARL